MAINTRLIGNLGSGGGQLHQSIRRWSVTIGVPGKSYLVQISGISTASSEVEIKYGNMTVGTSTRSSAVILDGGGILSGRTDFIAVWQEIDGYTNH